MNKKDFWSLMACNFVTLVLLLEHLAGLELALECMCIWTAASMLLHIHILKDYVNISIEVEEDY